MGAIAGVSSETSQNAHMKRAMDLPSALLGIAMIVPQYYWKFSDDIYLRACDKKP